MKKILIIILSAISLMGNSQEGFYNIQLSRKDSSILFAEMGTLGAPIFRKLTPLYKENNLGIIINTTTLSNSTAGRLLLDSNGKVSESSYLFYNSTLNRLGINTSTPAATLDVSSNTYAYGSDVTSPGMSVSGTFTYTGGGEGGNAALIDNTTVRGADPSGLNAATYFQVDIGSTKNIRRLSIKKGSIGGFTNAATCKLEYSDDNSTYTQSGANFVMTAGTGTTDIFDFSDNGAHRYWKISFGLGATGGNAHVEEIEFKEYVGTPSSKFQIDSTGKIILYNGIAPATGTMLIGDGTSFITLPIGTTGQKLKVLGGTAVWADTASGGVGISASATLDFGSTGSGAVADLTISVTGAALSDVVVLGIPSASVTATATYTAWVSAVNTVTVRFSPKATEDPASGVFKVRVLQ